MSKDVQPGTRPMCLRCLGHDFVNAQVRRDPKSFELIHQVLCARRDCQVVLGVMSMSSLARRSS